MDSDGDVKSPIACSVTRGDFTASSIFCFRISAPIPVSESSNKEASAPFQIARLEARGASLLDQVRQWLYGNRTNSGDHLGRKRSRLECVWVGHTE